MYIIAEYLFIENFIINYLILRTTKKITRSKISNKRIFLTGILSAIYSFVYFYDATIFLTNFYMKIIISMIIVKLAYNAENLRLYLKQLSSFYLISFIFGGTTLGIYYFANNYLDDILNKNNLEIIFPVKYLVLGIFLGTIIIINILTYYYEKTTREEFIFNIQICLNEKEIYTRALLDTGNSLVEPLTKLPVFIVEYKLIKDLLPVELNKIFKEEKENDFIFLEKIIRQLEGEVTINLIPFKSVGNKGGILLGIRPDYITVFREEGKEVIDELIIGIFNGKLSIDDQYNSLLNNEILNRGYVNVNEY